MSGITFPAAGLADSTGGTVTGGGTGATVSDLKSQLTFIGSHDSNGLPAELGALYTPLVRNYFNTTTTGKGSQLNRDLVGAPTVGGTTTYSGSVAANWNTGYPEAANNWTGASTNAASWDPTIHKDAFAVSSTFSYAAILRVLGTSCGYQNMIGYRFPDLNGLYRYYIAIPNTAALTINVNSPPMIVVRVYGVDQSGSNNQTVLNDGIRDYPCLTTPTVAADVYIKANASKSLQFFVISDGWGRWVRGEAINTNHLFFMNNASVSGPDGFASEAKHFTGHVLVNVPSGFTTSGGYTTNYQYAICGVEDGHMTSAASNTYQHVSDGDLHDVLFSWEMGPVNVVN